MNDSLNHTQYDSKRVLGRIADKLDIILCIGLAGAAAYLVVNPPKQNPDTQQAIAVLKDPRYSAAGNLATEGNNYQHSDRYRVGVLKDAVALYGQLKPLCPTSESTPALNCRSDLENKLSNASYQLRLLQKK